MVKPNIFLVSKNSHLPTLTRFQNEANSLGITAKIISPDELSELSLTQDDFIINRVTGITYEDDELHELSTIEKRTKTTICNSPAAVFNFRDKKKQYDFLLGQGVKTPQSIALGDFDFHNPPFKGPYIIKPLRGNKGIGVEFLNDLNELLDFHHQKAIINDLRYIVQPYIKKESELRLFLIKGELIGALQKSVQDKICNASRVACTFIETKQLPVHLQEIARALTEASGLFYTGIDVMILKDEYIFLELNTSPGFIEFEKYSGLNIAHKILMALIGDDRKK